MFRFRASYNCFVLLLLLRFPISAQTTTININSDILQNQVKRLGMGLGVVNFYDSGQMLKNLVVSNPSFEGQIAQSMIQCGGGTVSSCTDANGYTGWPADFWAGATYSFIYGAAQGRSGTVAAYTGANNGTPGVFKLSDSVGPAPSSGDYMIVKKAMLGGAEKGWSYTTGGNGSITTNTTDLPPGTAGLQTIALKAPKAGDNATITYYFDSTAGHTFVQFNGSYALSFKAKSLGGSNSAYVSLKRLNYPSTVYVDQTVALTNSWQTYTIPFNGTENGLVATAQLQFVTAAPGIGYPASSFALDDVSLVQTSNLDSTNNTVFRDPVVRALKQLNPGVLRFWFNQEGETLDNMLAPDTGRQRSAYSGYGANGDINTPYVEYSLTEFLQLCKTVGSGASSPIEPWVVIPITLSNAEASNLIDYLAGPVTTAYGAKRAAAGQTDPWTKVFPKIHLEFGNEAWNLLFYGGSMTDSQAYGTRAQTVFAAMRNNGNFNASSFDLMINANSYNTWGGAVIQSYCNNNDSFVAQPYLMLNARNPADAGLMGAAAIEDLFGSTLAEPEAFVTNSGTAEGTANGLVLQNQRIGMSSGKPFAVTETNVSPYGGSITQSQLDSYVSSMGAGLAVVDSMLQNMRIGILTQNVFQLSEYSYYRGDGKSTFLFGSVVDMGVTNRKRPQFLAEQVANNAIGANTIMLRTAHTGQDPTWNQPLVNSVQLNNAHYLQSFAFTGGGNYSLIVLNTNRSASEQVNFGGPNLPGGTVQMTRLTSANITDTNETANIVAPVSSTIANFNPASAMTLPPFSMTVLTWTAPAISNVTVRALTINSATITWTTDIPATSQVNYGTTSVYGSKTLLDGTLVTSHSVTVTGLTSGTTYDFSVSSANTTSATSSSSNLTFATLASFTIGAPITVTAPQGATTNVPVTVLNTNGYTGPVILSLSGAPSGLKGTFQAVLGGATLALTVASTVPAATYALTIVGTAGSTVQTVPLSLVVQQLQATTVSMNFVGGGNQMAASEVAGVIPKPSWNQAVGATGTMSLMNETGAPTGATATWSSPGASGYNGVWSLPIADTPGNKRMMRGYLDPTGGSATVTVTGLPVSSNGYDIYVYANGDNIGMRVSSYRISGIGIAPQSQSLKDNVGAVFSGTFTQAINSAGNYVMFSVAATQFTLTATPVSASDNTLRAPLNGLQIVPRTTPISMLNRISVDFVGGGMAMASTEIAGVVASANWNVAQGAKASSGLPLVDSTGASTGATVIWSTSTSSGYTGTWTLPITNTPGNARMMQGYLDPIGGSASVTVTGLASDPNGYRVIVYSDGDNASATRSGTYQISGPTFNPTSIGATDAASTNFSGVFTQSNGTAGNYAVFSITGTQFTLTATPGPSTDAYPRSPINGIQVIPQ